MNKKALGAITMVLVGSVTFSITNNLLTNQPDKPLPQENNFIISDNEKTAVNNNPKDKNEQVQTPETGAEETFAINTLKDKKAVLEIKNVVPAVSDKPVTPQEVSNKATVQVQKKNTPAVSVVSPDVRTTTSAPSTVQDQKTIKTVTTSTKPTTTTKTLPSQPSTSKKTTNTSTTKTTATTTNTTTNTTTTTANHGQQVSEEAKARAVTRKEQKEDNGKKK